MSRQQIDTRSPSVSRTYIAVGRPGVTRCVPMVVARQEVMLIRRCGVEKLAICCRLHCLTPILHFLPIFGTQNQRTGRSYDLQEGR